MCAHLIIPLPILLCKLRGGRQVNFESGSQAVQIQICLGLRGATGRADSERHSPSEANESQVNIFIHQLKFGNSGTSLMKEFIVNDGSSKKERFRAEVVH